MRFSSSLKSIFLFAGIVLIVTGFRSCPDRSSYNGWESYAGFESTRFSSLREINKKNVDQLEKAWDFFVPEEAAISQPNGPETMQLTPIVKNGAMYACSANSSVFKINPVDGTLLKAFYPKKRADKMGVWICRGVAYWENNQTEVLPGECNRTVSAVTMDGFLFSLDADSLELCKNFGDNGYVDLRQGLGAEKHFFEYYFTSAPTIYQDDDLQQIIVGSAIYDNQRMNAPSGVIRAFDLKTGKLAWAWNPYPKREDWDEVPSDLKLYEIPEETQRKISTPEYGDYLRGTPNSWTYITADPETKKVFVPMGNASPDFYYGDRHRSGFADYVSNLIAIDMTKFDPKTKSVKLAWRFKTLNNDVWDYDLASPPALVNLGNESRQKLAVIQATKFGYIYVLDRETGKPLPGFEVGEFSEDYFKDVVPGEEPALTQPRPSFPKPLDSKHMIAPPSEWEPLFRETMSALLSPFLETEEAKQPYIDEAFNFCQEGMTGKWRYEGPFQPNSTQPSLQVPGTVGGYHWGSLAVTPDGSRLVTYGNHYGMLMTLIEKDEEGQCDTSQLTRGGSGTMEGTPYCLDFGLSLVKFTDPRDPKKQMRLPLICTKPPWGTLQVYDLRKKEQLLGPGVGKVVPTGNLLGIEGSISIGGPSISAGGLIFAAGTADGQFVARDINTGKVLWSDDLGYHDKQLGAFQAGVGSANPMIYSIDGEQYVTIAVGKHYILPLRAQAKPFIRTYKLKK